MIAAGTRPTQPRLLLLSYRQVLLVRLCSLLFGLILQVRTNAFRLYFCFALRFLHSAFSSQLSSSCFTSKHSLLAIGPCALLCLQDFKSPGLSIAFLPHRHQGWAFSSSFFLTLLCRVNSRLPCPCGYPRLLLRGSCSPQLHFTLHRSTARLSGPFLVRLAPSCPPCHHTSELIEFSCTFPPQIFVLPHFDCPFRHHARLL